MNGLSFLYTIAKLLWRAAILVLSLAILSTIIIVFPREGLSGSQGSHGNQTIFLASASDSRIADPTTPRETIEGITSLQDLEGLPCRRGWNEIGKVDMSYDQVTGEIHLWCNPVSVRVSSLVQSNKAVTDVAAFPSIVDGNR